MKIAFLSAYSGPVNRGTESYVYEIANRLHKHHEVIVFQLGKKGNEQYRVETIDIHVDYSQPDTSNTKERKYGLDYWSSMLARFTFACIPTLLDFKPDIVIPLNGHWQYDITKRYCDFSGAKLVITGQWDHDVHGLEIQPDAYVALSDIQFQWATKTKYKGKLVLIPNGIDTITFNPKGDILDLGFKNECKTILAVGQLNKQKNIESVIRAVSRVPDCNLIVCGEGEKKQQLTKLSQELIPGRYKCISLDYQDMPKLYRSVDAFIHIPTQEAFGLVYLEALASNLPVIATGDDTRKKLIGNAGLYVQNVHDIQEIADTIEQSLTANFEDRPQTRAKQYDWNRIAGEYEKLFTSLKDKISL